MKREKKKLSVRKILFRITGFILIFSIISMIFVKIIYDRQFPRFERYDETVTAYLRYSDLEPSYPRRLVTFKSGNNMLQGYVYGHENDKGLVVISHGLGGGADSYLPQISYFVDRGWLVFAYDVTGSFGSEGKSTKGFPQSLIDLDAALTYIKTQSEFSKLPVLLFGHSWGGYATGNILHFGHDIKGIVSIAGPNSAMEMIIEQAKYMMGVFAYLQYPYLWLYQTILFGKTASVNAVDAINRFDVPFMIIHGTGDESVSYEGSSIISKYEFFINPNVRTITITEPGRNGHNSIFRSNDAISYIDVINKEYRELYDSYQGNIPYDVNRDFYFKINRFLAQDLDKSLMDEIHNFFIECLQ